MASRRHWRDAKGIRWLPEAQRESLPPAERAEYDQALAAEVRRRKLARLSAKDPGMRSTSIRTVTGGLPTLGKS